MNSPALHIFCGALRTSVDESRPIHNVFADGGPASAMEIARSLGDLSHNVYTSVSEKKPREVLLLDFWADPEGMQRFFSDGRVREAGGRLCSSYDETSWTPVRDAFAFRLPPKAGHSARFVAMARAPVKSVEDAVAEFNRLVSMNAATGRSRGQVSHDLYVRIGAPGTPEIIGVDFWSTLERLREHYRDEPAWHGFGASFAGPRHDSVWEQAAGFVEW